MTITDIAKEAGLSIATVSRVLNNLPVREENRKKVEAVIKRLDYVPNLSARSLVSKQSYAVGVLITSFSNEYNTETTEAIEKKLADKGFMLFLCSTDGNAASERKYLSDLISRSVDGIVVLDPLNENYAAGLFRGVAQRVPLVLVHSNPEILDIDSIVIDQKLGMRKVMDHLFSLGHKEIAFMRGRDGYSYDIKEEEWRRYLAERDAAPKADRLIVLEQGNNSEAIGLAMESIASTLRSRRPPTAVFACNDLMAMGVIIGASRLGARVPEDLTVVGHDNTQLAISGGTQLSSVDLKMKSLGTAAVDLLFHAMEGTDPEPRRVLITPDLIVRESSGPKPDRPFTGAR
jgi:LacI family transcriptional regulator